MPGTRGEHVTHASWESFVIAKPLKGLGSTTDMIDRIVRGQPDLETMIDAATQRPHGGDRRSADINVDVIHVERPTGTSREAALRRLRTQRPDLHAEVIAGRLTPHAAAVIAGMRPPTMTIRVDDPTSAARAIASG
jgi:hypothetical protein